MTANATFSALLPLLIDSWHLSNSEAGTISGVYYAGYIASVPVLTGMTDRIDARRIYLLSCTLSSLAAFGFAFLAEGFWSALLLQGLGGAGLGGTYMPGLKILADNVQGRQQSRLVAVYTSTFGLGTALSLWLAGTMTSLAGWQAAFVAAGVGPVIAGSVVFFGMPPRLPRQSLDPARRLPDFRSVFSNRSASGYILGYTAHCWELFGFRSWIVAFFAFAGATRASIESNLPSATTLAAVINLVGPAASIFGNELATRFDRPRVIVATMSLSAMLGCSVGFSASLHGWLVFALAGVYFLAIMGDSAALTAGLIEVAQPPQRGAAMAVHSFLGFGAAFIAPIAFGAILDTTGGNSRIIAWGVAFASLGVGCALAPIVYLLSQRPSRAQAQSFLNGRES